MSTTYAKTSQDTGLQIASMCGKHLVKTRHLHYGYWNGDLDVDITNLYLAQEHYVDLLVSHIPPEVETILDVGCGTGGIAETLVSTGHQVDCVSPSPFLSSETRRGLGDGCCIFECLFEDVRPSRPYDLILFSESFQYVRLEEALQKAVDILAPGGHVLICDFFRKEVLGKSLVGGGHRLAHFHEAVSRYPLTLVRDIDITDRVAPTIDVANKTLTEVLGPMANLGLELLRTRHRVLAHIVQFALRKRIRKTCDKYFSGQRTGEHFSMFKSYRLLLYRKSAERTMR